MLIEIETIKVNEHDFRVIKKSGDLILGKQIIEKHEAYKGLVSTDSGSWVLIMLVSDQPIIICKSSKRNFNKLTERIEGLIDE